jgi:hypothetical protein
MIGRNRRASPQRDLNRLPKPEATFRYEIVSLAPYGEGAGFPVTTDATLWDLRISHRYQSGATVEVPLYDVSGVRQIDLDSAAAFLRTDDFGLPQGRELVEVTVTGKIRLTTLDVSTGDKGHNAHLRPYLGFTLESIVVPGLYEILTVTDDRGQRYPIGTFGMLLGNSLPEENAFSELRRAARRTSLRIRSGHRLERPSLRKH